MLKLLESARVGFCFTVFKMSWEMLGTSWNSFGCADEVSHHEQILAVTWVDDSLCHSNVLKLS